MTQPLAPSPALTPHELELIREVFAGYDDVVSVKLFGSRAKGISRPQSDVDLAIWGAINDLQAEAIAAELDELPLPYRFEVRLFESIQSPELRAHIERVGIQIYPEPGALRSE